MALWPFGKKNDIEQAPAQEDAASSAAEAAGAAGAAASAQESPEADSAAPQIAVHEHDAVNGSMGPYDGDNVNIEDFDFGGFSVGLLDLGSLRIPLPKGSQVQVEMGENGPRMLHIVTEHGRMTPVAFAAPRKAGQWAQSAQDIVRGLTNDGFQAHPEDGPWGTEIVGNNGQGEIRIIGVDGPRWMYRLTLASPAGHEEALAAIGREVVARTFVYRGEAPILAGSSLPVTLPAQLAQQVQEALHQRQHGGQPPHQGQMAQAEQQQTPSAGKPKDDGAIADGLAQARQQLHDLNAAEDPAETPATNPTENSNENPTKES